MPRRTTHPGVSVSRRKRDGFYQLEWMPVGGTKRAYQVLDTRNRRAAVKEAEQLSADLAEARREFAELAAAGTEALAHRWNVESCIADWLARPDIKASTRKTARTDIATLREYCRAHEISYLDEITFGLLDQFRSRLAELDLSATTKNKRLRTAGMFLEWCKGKLRIATNPMHIGKIDGFKVRHRGSDERWISAPDRKALWDACNSTQERLMLALTMLAGLRSAEATHLTWGHWHDHVAPQELDITYTEPDELDPEGWDPKTGIRVVPLIWAELPELLDLWRAETAFGTGPDDPIIADPRTGKRYRLLPDSLYKRLHRETRVRFTWQIGRRVACALAVIHTGRLTGREWTLKEHEQVFGHRGQTATDYYFDPLLPRRRREEHDYLARTTADAEDEWHQDAVAEQAGPTRRGFSVPLAKELLKGLLSAKKISNLALSRHKDMPSDVAIGKWLVEGASVPNWFWTAVSVLLAK